MTEFLGTIKVTPRYSNCDPITVHGRWTLKDDGRPFKVWCDQSLYRGGINEEICEIIEVEKVIK